MRGSYDTQLERSGSRLRPDRSHHSPQRGIGSRGLEQFRSPRRPCRGFPQEHGFPILLQHGSSGHVRGVDRHTIPEILGHGHDRPTGWRPTHLVRLSQDQPPVQFNVQPAGSVPFVGTNDSSRGGVAQRESAHALHDVLVRRDSVGLPRQVDIRDDVPGSVRCWPDRHLGHECHSLGLVNSYHLNTVRVEKPTQPASWGTASPFGKNRRRDRCGRPTTIGVSGKAVADYKIAHRFVNAMSYELPLSGSSLSEWGRLRQSCHRRMRGDLDPRRCNQVYDSMLGREAPPIVTCPVRNVRTF